MTQLSFHQSSSPADRDAASVLPISFISRRQILMGAAVGLVASSAGIMSSEKAAAAPALSRPAGSNIIKYESTTGANLSARIDSVGTTKQVSFPKGVFTFNDFAQTNNGMMSLRAAGLRGSGRAYTIFEMRPNTSTKSRLVPASKPPVSNGTINPFRLMRVGWENATAPRYLSGFTLQATTQGHLHHGLHLYHLSPGSVVEDVLVKGVPGNLSREPGETMSVECFRCTGTKAKPIRLHTVEVDGRNSAGAAVGASGFAVNFGSMVKFEQTYAHHLRYGHGYALYETSNLTFVQARAENIGLNGFNFENVSGTVVLDRVKIASVGQIGTGYHVAIAANHALANYTIIDPIIEGKPVSAKNKLRVRISGYAGGRRTQWSTRIHLIVGGKDRPDLMTKIVTDM